MEKVSNNFSPFSCSVDNTNDDDGAACLCLTQQPTTTDSNGQNTRLPYRRPPSISTATDPDEAGNLSPLSQTSSVSSNSRRQLSVRRNYSQTLPSSPENLQLPTLSESRNDQEWVRFPFQSETKNDVFAMSTDGIELEVALRLDRWKVEGDNDDDDSNDDESSEYDAITASRLSFEQLEKKTDQLIHEARMAVLKQKEASDTVLADIRPSHPLIQEPLRFRSSAVPATPDSPDSHHLDTSVRDGEANLLSSAAMVHNSPTQVRTPLASDSRPPLSPVTPSGQLSPLTPSSGLPAEPPVSVHTHWPSPAESTLGSIDDDEKAMEKLPLQVDDAGEQISREKVLRKIDGLASPMAASENNNFESIHSNLASKSSEEGENSILSECEVDYRNYDGEVLSEMPDRVKKVKTVVIKSAEPKKLHEDQASFGNWFSFLWGGQGGTMNADGQDYIAEEYEENPLPRIAGDQPVPSQSRVPTASDILSPAFSEDNAEGYAEVVNAQEFYIDPRMPEWIDNQFTSRDPLPRDGAYQLSESRTVIVHELVRGSWTWCTAWSPDGTKLAMGTENHHLAVVDTFSTSVWRIKHDKRVTGPNRQHDVTHSIRSIAWGDQFIAIGGVGGSVSILSPEEPYPILHKIAPTGFVGSLDWLKDSNTLIIGSRNGKATIVKIWEEESDFASRLLDTERKVQSTILHTIDRESAWVNAVKFSPGGRAVAAGDSKGILGVYSYKEQRGEPVAIANIANFKLEDSILDIEWSPDGQWLYAGGEDFCVTVINTPTWEAVHRIKRGRWVQFISASHGCSHVAIGGVTSEVSIMDVDRGWDTALNVSLKGLVPLSAKWHPQDQYLVVTGQSNSVLAIETTNSRYVSGHFLRSVSPILSIHFSPDGRMAAIGNEAGIITIFKLSGTTFVTMYELVLDGDGSLSIDWSKDGSYIAVVAGSKVVVIAKSSGLSRSAPPNTSGFYVAQVVRDFELVHDVASSPNSRYVAISGFKKTRFLDTKANFKCILEIANEGTTVSNAWSPDGCWFATIGKNQHLLIYDTSSLKCSEWKIMFTVQTQQPGLTLAWGPTMAGGLQYIAYGGEGKKIYVLEIRTKERAWETVLAIPRDGVIHDLDWNYEGLLACAVGNGTVSVMDLSYLQSGYAVNEMDYNWQRQALTCFMEIRRNKGKNSMKSVCWIPSVPGSDSLLACGGTDGEVEIIDLTDRRRCGGYKKAAAIL